VRVINCVSQLIANMLKVRSFEEIEPKRKVQV
jgi:hypothetical protein